MSEQQNSAYAQAGVDTAAGDLAVELMKSAVARTHGPEVFGGVGGKSSRACNLSRRLCR